MAGFSEVWRWIRAHAWHLGVALVAMLGAGIWWHYYQGRILSLASKAAIETAKRRVAELDGRRAVLQEEAEEHAAEIQEIEAERKEIQRHAVSQAHLVAELSEAEIEAAFRELY